MHRLTEIQIIAAIKIMFLLTKRKEPWDKITQKDVAKGIGYSQAQTSQICKRLTHCGIIARDPEIGIVSGRRAQKYLTIWGVI
jgi:DNA-binding IclR family transcriptional regulator